VLRCLGYPEGRDPPPQVAARLETALEEARTLTRACGTWCAWPPTRAAEVGLAPIAARGLALGLVTLGPALEARIAALQAAGHGGEALLLDACGSAAAEEAADLLGARIAGVAVTEPTGPVGCRLSPGFGSWALSWQPALLGVLEADALGVRLSPGLMMIPRKSISFAQWLGASAPPAPGLAGCRACGLPRCRYRA
jgi:hypothetical protein